VQNTLYKDGSPDARGVRRSCFKKYCEDLRAESLLALVQVTPSKDPAPAKHHTLEGPVKPMVKNYYNFNEGIFLDHSHSGGDSSHKGGGGSSSAKGKLSRNFNDPYSSQGQ
jgi:hypothetical protein